MEPTTTGKVCGGACGRWRPLGAFHQKPKGFLGRQQICRDCRSGRPVPATDVIAMDPLSLVDRYEALLVAYRDHKVSWDDPAWSAVRRGVEAMVRRHGGLVVRGVRYGWDWCAEQVRRVPAGPVGPQQRTACRAATN